MTSDQPGGRAGPAGPDRFLGPADPLPGQVSRVVVAGASGAGKSTVAAEIGRRTDLRYTEVDALHWGAGWTSRPTFVADVTALAAQECWVVEWQYDDVRGLLADRADLLVWLDLPRWRVLAQVVRRTLRRRLRRQPLWGGNLEPPLWTILTDPEHIVRWSWQSHARLAPRIETLRRTHPGLPVVRLRSWGEVGRWLDGPFAGA